MTNFAVNAGPNPVQEEAVQDEVDQSESSKAEAVRLAAEATSSLVLRLLLDQAFFELQWRGSISDTSSHNWLPVNDDDDVEIVDELIPWFQCCFLCRDQDFRSPEELVAHVRRREHPDFPDYYDDDEDRERFIQADKDYDQNKAGKKSK